MKRNKNDSIIKILDFISEAGLLKMIKRSGWSVIGLQNQESVAEHSFRCAVIGYILAHLEGAQINNVILMTLFGDIHEARITDLHKMAQKYIRIEEAEKKAFYAQTAMLPEEIKDELARYRREYDFQRSPESIIARDADILECLLQAKEYYEFGHKRAAIFMRKAPRLLKTKSAQQLWKIAKKIPLTKWWQPLSKISR